jgi:hypothetical protein
MVQAYSLCCSTTPFTLSAAPSNEIASHISPLRTIDVSIVFATQAGGHCHRPRKTCSQFQSSIARNKIIATA